MKRTLFLVSVAMVATMMFSCKGSGNKEQEEAAKVDSTNAVALMTKARGLFGSIADKMPGSSLYNSGMAGLPT